MKVLIPTYYFHSLQIKIKCKSVKASSRPWQQLMEIVHNNLCDYYRNRNKQNVTKREHKKIKKECNQS